MDAMFHDYNLFTSREIKTIWTVTNKLRNNEPVYLQQFDHCIEVLDAKKPDLTYDELVMLANYHGIIDLEKKTNELLDNFDEELYYGKEA